MRLRIYQILSKRFPAVLWTLIIFILLSLPGKMLPSETHLTIPQLDKYVHMFLFGCFVFLWSYYYASKSENKNISNNFLLRIFVIASLYGTLMEFIQKYFIPNRDYDIYDILADVAGAALAALIVRLTLTKLIRDPN
jgi:VanZ family protein